MRRRIALTLALLALTGCARARDSQGGGSSVDVCTGYKAYDDLAAPAPADAKAVLTYADGVARIVDRVDTGIRIHGDEVPPGVVTDLKTVRASMRRFHAQFAAARSDVAAQRAAVASLRTDSAYLTADGDLAAYVGERCRRQAPAL